MTSKDALAALREIAAEDWFLDALEEHANSDMGARDLLVALRRMERNADASDATAERTKVVAWLRVEEKRLRGEVRSYGYSGPDPFEFKAEAAEFFADAIERGEHDK